RRLLLQVEKAAESKPFVAHDPEELAVPGAQFPGADPLDLRQELLKSFLERRQVLPVRFVRVGTNGSPPRVHWGAHAGSSSSCWPAIHLSMVRQMSGTTSGLSSGQTV